MLFLIHLTRVDLTVVHFTEKNHNKTLYLNNAMIVILNALIMRAPYAMIHAWNYLLTHTNNQV